MQLKRRTRRKLLEPVVLQLESPQGGEAAEHAQGQLHHRVAREVELLQTHQAAKQPLGQMLQSVGGEVEHD